MRDCGSPRRREEGDAEADRGRLAVTIETLPHAQTDRRTGNSGDGRRDGTPDCGRGRTNTRRGLRRQSVVRAAAPDRQDKYHSGDGVERHAPILKREKEKHMSNATNTKTAGRDPLRSMVAQFPASHMDWLDGRAERNHRSRRAELAVIVENTYRRDAARKEAK